MKIKSFLKLDFIALSFSVNRKLPKWLEVDIVDDVIYFSGTPKEPDQGRLMIQIIDKKDYVVKEFYIDIKQSGSP